MAKAEKPSKKASPATKAGKERLYTLVVFIVSGPVTEKFAKKNPEISRTIQIRGDQTLEELHHAIFDAFDREEEHLFEYQFGKKPMDPNGPRYVLHDDGEKHIAGLVSETTIDSLGLEVGRSFGYWFDFGDDCYHQIDVVAIEEAVLRRRYPRVIERVGESPPQYADLDEEGE
jgi:hypothetical protein